MKRTKIGRCLLQDIIEHRGYSQQQVADISGVSTTQISEYITGKRKSMSMQNARKLAQALNCAIDDLYEWNYPNR